MVQGASSDAGKSLVTAALCRWLKRQGVRVAPFKPQNMALNSAVTVDGGEIGRAQALQAIACGIEPHTDMNPVLLKPNTDTGTQVIIQGQAVANMDATAYHHYKSIAKDAVLSSFERLNHAFEAIVVEGAGSPAEINLRDRDIANMGFAELVDCPVVLVADIDRGGVFAQIVGTLALLSARERARIVGFIINRFRGDLSLLQPGLDWLEKETQKPVLGVLPYLKGLYLDEEDSLRPSAMSKTTAEKLRVIVPALPRISNHTDLAPLHHHPQVDLRIIGQGAAIPAADLVILPGSKSVRSDLAWLREQGWETALQRHLRYGGKLLGICGGFQMLGQSIADPYGIEGEAGESKAFGWLEMTTTLQQHKQLYNVQGVLDLDQTPVTGYEIHAGISSGHALTAFPAIQLDDGRYDGAFSQDRQILGTYLHGLFETPQALAKLLSWAGLSNAEHFDMAARREESLEKLADIIDHSLDTQMLRQLFELMCFKTDTNIEVGFATKIGR